MINVQTIWKSSHNRPGVATTISGFFLRILCCFCKDIPPTIVATWNAIIQVKQLRLVTKMQMLSDFFIFERAKTGLAQNQDNVFELSDKSIHRLRYVGMISSETSSSSSSSSRQNVNCSYHDTAKKLLTWC
jgi:hypothetical protein